LTSPGHSMIKNVLVTLFRIIEIQSFGRAWLSRCGGGVTVGSLD
jgi:hypothetical protein